MFALILFIWVPWVKGLLNVDASNNIDEQTGNVISYKPTSRWRLTSEGYSQRYTELTWSDRVTRMQQLLSAYDLPQEETRPAIKTIARIHNVYPEVLICISYADSSLGKFLKTKHNYGNVGNNDRWDTQSYSSLEKWFNAIWKTLNNQYLKSYISIEQLSRRWNSTWLVYATSQENWHINLLNCLGMIRNKRVPDNFAFRF